MKKTVKSSVKKYQTGGRTAQNSPGSGRVPTVTPKKAPNKTVTKKDGKVIVTYDSKTRSWMTDFLGTAPYAATVKKVYDNKGNLISGTKTTKGSYGSSTTEKIKDPVKKKPTTTKSTTTPKTESKPKTLNVYAPKPKPKAPTKPATNSAAKTVSQMWVEKTGTPWTDAKKQGLTDGTAAGNMALMKKLQTGNRMEFMSSGYKIPSEDEARAMDDAYDAAYGPAKTTMRRGGRVKSKMKSKKK